MTHPAKNGALHLNTAKKTGMSFSKRRAGERQVHRARASARVTIPVNVATTRDPLEKERSLWTKKALFLTLYITGAFAVHGAVIFFASMAPESKEISIPDNVSEKLVMKLSEPARKLIPKNDPPSIEQVEPPAPLPMVQEETQVKKKKVQKKIQETVQAVADPIDPVAESSSEKPQRKIVGISLESTVSAGKGPSFAVGNSRMGRTADSAENYKGLGKLASGKASGTGSGQSANKLATRIPGEKTVFIKPKRISKLNPEYPQGLKAKGIEGNVVVLVRINENGEVLSVKILKSSGYEDLDASASKTASKDRFSPASKDGVPVEYSLKYTYRFRIKES